MTSYPGKGWGGKEKFPKRSPREVVHKKSSWFWALPDDRPLSLPSKETQGSRGSPSTEVGFQKDTCHHLFWD
jgi:hypothetical protein